MAEKLRVDLAMVRQGLAPSRERAQALIMAGQVYVNGHLVALTYKEYELLRKLMKNPGVVLTREQLLGEIWGYDYIGETRTVDVHVRTLRQKLGEAEQWVQTVRGVGYRLGGAYEK